VRHFDGLEDFSLNVIHSTAITEHLSLHLSDLNRNLKRVNIEAPSAIQAFNAQLIRDPTSFPCLESLWLGNSSAISVLEVNMPSNLKELKLGLSVQVQALSLSQLPIGLTSLECDVITFTIPEECPKFPLGLKELILRTSGQLPNLFRSLPTGCQKVVIRSSDILHTDANISDEEWTALSQIELNHLDCSAPENFDAQHAQRLPKTLQSLSLRMNRPFREDWSCSVLQALPQKLKYLYGVWGRVITVAIAQAMPRSLEMTLQEAIDPEAVAYLPYNILGVRLAEDCDLGLIRSFPSRLAHLRTPDLPNSIASILPHGLNGLTLEHNEAKLTQAIIGLLPTNLLSLRINSASRGPFDRWEDLEALPKGLNSLRLVSQYSKERRNDLVRLPTASHTSQCLPRTLKNLSLGCLDIPPSAFSDWIGGLPTNLQTLHLLVSALPREATSAFRGLSNLHLLEIGVLDSPEGGWSQVLQNLPENLGYLACFDHGSSGPTDITNMVFKHLPRTLWCLILPDSPQLDRECLSNLPALGCLYFGRYQTPSWFLT
jgi:hypothetical protein